MKAYGAHTGCRYAALSHLIPVASEYHTRSQREVSGVRGYLTVCKSLRISSKTGEGYLLLYLMVIVLTG